MIKKSLLLLFICLLVFSCSLESQDSTIMIPMRDEVNLSTQILFPQERQEHYPVVLVRTPYKKERRIPEYNYLLDNGYVVVLQDVRGRFGSEGTFEPFMNESEDGYDTIDWISKQNWCDGNIGMIGASYNGYVQYCAASEKHPNLKTIIPNVALVDVFHDGPYLNGIFGASSLRWSAILEAIGTDEEINNMDWVRLLNNQPVSELDSIVFSKKIDYYQKWVIHDSRDTYWKRAFSVGKLKKINIPVFIQSGWFDSSPAGCKLAYKELTAAGNKNVKLTIGPWGHTDEESTFFGDQFMGEAADDIKLEDEYLKWLNYWLKGENNGIMDEPKVQLYLTYGNKWHKGNEYPVEKSIEEKLYLSAQKEDTLNTNGKLISNAELIEEGFTKYEYNPGNAPVITNEVFKQIMQNKFDGFEKLLEKHNDYLIFKTDEIEKDETYLGGINAKIYASSSAVDTDWFALLFVMNSNDKIESMIGFGALRAAYRNSVEKLELLEKDKIYPFDIDMAHFGLKIDKGKKLGLMITSSFGNPFLAKNLNTGKNNLLETNYEIAGQKIYHTKEYNSYITISVLNNEIE